MTGKSRASLFLIEKLIVIAVFAICASACAGIFVESYIMSNNAKDLNNALIAAKNGAERFKAYGDLKEVDKPFSLGHEIASDGTITVYYDEQWRRTFGHLASYSVNLYLIDGEPDYIRKLTVETIEREEILSFTVSARGNQK